VYNFSLDVDNIRSEWSWTLKKTCLFDGTGEAEPLEDEGRKEVRSPLRVVSDGSLPLRF